MSLDALVTEIADLVAVRVIGELEARWPEPTSAEPWRLLTLTEAAERLGRSSRWVRERVKRGDLPHVRLDGGAFAFELDDLKAFAEARRVSADDADPLAARLRGARDPASDARSANGRRLGKPKVARG